MTKLRRNQDWKRRKLNKIIFLNKLLEFTPHLDIKSFIESVSQRNINQTTIDGMEKNCFVIVRSHSKVITESI